MPGGISRLSKWTDFYHYSGLALSFGLLMAGSLFFGYQAGSWLDQRFDTSPFFLVIVLLLAGAYPLYAIVIKLQLLAKRDSAEKNKKSAKDHNQRQVNSKK